MPYPAWPEDELQRLIDSALNVARLLKLEHDGINQVAIQELDNAAHAWCITVDGNVAAYIETMEGMGDEPTPPRPDRDTRLLRALRRDRERGLDYGVYVDGTEGPQ